MGREWGNRILFDYRCLWGGCQHPLTFLRGERTRGNNAGARASLTLHCAEGKGTFDSKRSASGRPAGTVAVPFGDMGSDRSGLLARQKSTVDVFVFANDGAGKLKARVKIASAWGASYNAVVGVGDITGDGKNGLVARDSAGSL